MSNLLLDRLNGLNLLLTQMQREIVGIITALQRAGEQSAAETPQASAAPTQVLPPATSVQLNEVPVEKVSTPTAEAPAQPTLERPMTGATVSDYEKNIANKADAQAARRKEELLTHFIGLQSVFARFLSPLVMNNARGVIKPNEDGVGQYQEDIRFAPVEMLAKWPSGFYRNRETQEAQFFIRGTGYMAYIDRLPSNNQEPVVIAYSVGNVCEKTGIREYGWEELQGIREALERALVQMVSRKNA